MSSPAPRPSAVVVFRPEQLISLRRRFQRAADGLDGSRREILSYRDLRLNRADPGFSVAGFTSRAETAIIELDRAARDLRSDADLLGRTALQSSTADAGALQCRLPESVRRRIDEEVGRRLGSLLALVSVGLIDAADRILSSAEPDDRHGSADAGGTFTSRSVRLPLRSGSTGALIDAALGATNDQRLLRHDEFGLIDHGRRRFTVVLPGVTDLSQPDRGWHDVHRSARDLDMAAVPSSRSSRLDDNRYGQMVVEALAVNGVPDGATLMLVGHSFGADTALDLAADPAFGERYAVSRVVATGYHSQPQLAAANADTDILVVQNRHDLVIKTTVLMPTESSGILGCNLPPAESEQPTPSTAGHHIVVFSGDWRQLGHDVATYQAVFNSRDRDHMGDADRTRGDRVGQFLLRADADGFGSAGTMTAIDISLPSR